MSRSVSCFLHLQGIWFCWELQLTTLRIWPFSLQQDSSLPIAQSEVLSYLKKINSRVRQPVLHSININGRTLEREAMMESECVSLEERKECKKVIFMLALAFYSINCYYLLSPSFLGWTAYEGINWGKPFLWELCHFWYRIALPNAGPPQKKSPQFFR